jgi:hypothetical protein
LHAVGHSETRDRQHHPSALAQFDLPLDRIAGLLIAEAVANTPVAWWLSR